MKRRKLFFLCGLLLFCGTIGNKITAAAQDTVWNSQGTIVFDNHTEEKNDDVVVDASDMEKLLQGETGETLFNSSGRIVFDNNTPEVFEKYFAMQYEKSVKAKNDFIFINAWNEWGEGNYIEPDLKFGRGYLEALKKVIIGK